MRTDFDILCLHDEKWVEITKEYESSLKIYEGNSYASPEDRSMAFLLPSNERARMDFCSNVGTSRDKQTIVSVHISRRRRYKQR